MLQWTWLTLLAVTSVPSDGAIDNWPRYSIKRISEEPLMYSMEMPTLQKPPILESYHLKREKRHLHESEPISIPRQRRCHGGERHLQNIRNQPSVLDESSSLEQTDTTKRDTKATYGHHLHPTLPTIYPAPKKDYNALKDYLNLMHQMQRDAYNTLQNKLKETISRTKQPWRDDPLTRLNKPFSNPAWGTQNHVSSSNYPALQNTPKWHGVYSQPIASKVPSENHAMDQSNHNYLQSLPVVNEFDGKTGLEKTEIDPEEQKIVEMQQDPNPYVEQQAMKSLETEPDSNQNHFHYMGEEKDQSETVESVPNPHENPLNYVGAVHSTVQETPIQSRQDDFHYDEGKDFVGKSEEGPGVLNQEHFNYMGGKEPSVINPEHDDFKNTDPAYKDTETLQNSHQNYIENKPTEKPLENVVNPSSDLSYNNAQIPRTSLENLPIQKDVSISNNPNTADTQILQNNLAPNVEHKLPTTSNTQQEKIEHPVKSTNSTKENPENEVQQTTEKSQQTGSLLGFHIPEQETNKTEETTTPKTVPPVESHHEKFQKHSENLAEKMQNFNDKKQALDEMVANILNMQRANPTPNPAAQVDLQKIMDSLQTLTKDSEKVNPIPQPPTLKKPTEIPEILHQNRFLHIPYDEKTEEAENHAAEENTQQEKLRVRKIPPGIRRIPQQAFLPQWPGNFQQQHVTPPWSQNLHQQQSSPNWSQYQQKSSENFPPRPRKPQFSKKFRKEQTTPPYQVQILKDPGQKTKKSDYPLKFLRKIAKTEEPYQIIEETATETPEEKLIKLLASSAEPEVIEEIRHELQELKRFFHENVSSTTIRPHTDEKSSIPTEDKIIIPLDHQHPKIIMIDPNEVKSKQVQYIDTRNQHKQLGAPVFSFAGGDPTEHDELMKTPPEENDDEEYHKQVEKIANDSLPKNFPWHLYYPSYQAPNVTKSNPASQVLEHHQKTAEMTVKEHGKHRSQNPIQRIYPTKTSPPLSHSFPQYAKNYPYDPSMLRETPIENLESHIPEKRSCNCGSSDPLQSTEQLTLPSNSLNDCPCRRSRPSQATQDLSDFIAEQQKLLTKKIKDCSSDESDVESKQLSCGCHASSESEEMPKSLQAKRRQQTCSCGLAHADDDCENSNALRSTRSHSEPDKYEILNNMLLWFKRLGKKSFRF